MPRPNSTKNLPNGLRRARMAKGLTLEQVEELVGIPWRNIQRYETGKIGTPIHMLPTFAKAYGMRPADLVDAEPTMSQDELDILKAYNRLTPHAKRQALAILQTLASHS